MKLDKENYKRLILFKLTGFNLFRNKVNSWTFYGLVELENMRAGSMIFPHINSIFYIKFDLNNPRKYKEISDIIRNKVCNGNIFKNKFNFKYYEKKKRNKNKKIK